MGNNIKEMLNRVKNNIPESIKKEDIEILEGDENKKGNKCKFIYLQFAANAMPSQFAEGNFTYIKKNLKMGGDKSGYGFLLTENKP